MKFRIRIIIPVETETDWKKKKQLGVLTCPEVAPKGGGCTPSKVYTPNAIIMEIYTLKWIKPTILMPLFKSRGARGTKATIS